MAKPDAQADHGNSGRTAPESPLADGETAGSLPGLTSPEAVTASEVNGDADGEEAAWGFTPRKSRMSREVKIGLPVIIILLAGFAYFALIGHRTHVERAEGEEVVRDPSHDLDGDDDDFHQYTLSNTVRDVDDESNGTVLADFERDETRAARNERPDRRRFDSQDDGQQYPKRDFNSPVGNQQEPDFDEFTRPAAQEVAESGQAVADEFGSASSMDSDFDGDPFAAVRPAAGESRTSKRPDSAQPRRFAETGFDADQDEFAQAELAQNDAVEVDEDVFPKRKPRGGREPSIDDDPFAKPIEAAQGDDSVADAAADEVFDPFAQPVTGQKKPGDGKTPGQRPPGRQSPNREFELLDEETVSEAATAENDFEAEAAPAPPADDLPGDDVPDRGASIADDDDRFGEFRPIKRRRAQAESTTIVEPAEGEPETAEAVEEFDEAGDDLENLFDEPVVAAEDGKARTNKPAGKQPDRRVGRAAQRSNDSDEADQAGAADVFDPIDPFEQASSPAAATSQPTDEGEWPTRTAAGQPRGSAPPKPFYQEFPEEKDLFRPQPQTQPEPAGRPKSVKPAETKSAEHLLDSASPFEHSVPDDPQPGVYVVQTNDNYWSISKKEYGTGRYHLALARYNKHRIPDPRRMRPGMKVLIPQREILEARNPELFPKPGGTQTANAQGPAGFFFGPEGQPMYRVGKDDTLGLIAQRHLGRSSRWVQVYEMNKTRLKNPNDLQIGTVLRLPADASQVRLVQRPIDGR